MIKKNMIKIEGDILKAYCPYCGEELEDNRNVFFSNPPIYRFKCNCCNRYFDLMLSYPISIKDAKKLLITSLLRRHYREKDVVEVRKMLNIPYSKTEYTVCANCGELAKTSVDITKNGEYVYYKTVYKCNKCGHKGFTTNGLCGDVNYLDFLGRTDIQLANKKFKKIN